MDEPQISSQGLAKQFARLVPEQKQIKHTLSQGPGPRGLLQPFVSSTGEDRPAETPPWPHFIKLLGALYKVSHFIFTGT